MYKKIMVLSALLCTFTQYASENRFDVASWLEFKPSYFFFAASPMNAVYDKGGFQVQGSASLPVCHYLDVYASVGYRQAWGHALNSEEETSLTVIPVDIGLKPVFNFCERFNYFIAAGPRYFNFFQYNNSSYVDAVVTNAGVGLFVNTGFNVQLAESFVLGVFGEYSYEKKTIESNLSNVYSNGSVQLGGFAFGLSLGYEF